MSLELCILASGSSGNCSVLRTPGGAMLIDAGIGPRTAGRRMDGTGVSVHDMKAICLTHLDSDHFTRHWVQTIIAHQIRLLCHESETGRLLELAAFERDEREIDSLRALISPFNGEVFSPLTGLRIHSITLPHDQSGSNGFVIEGFETRIGYATDLGRVPASLLKRFCDLDVLAIESNYDTEMELNSPRPSSLKNRIMGGSGHLSNEQALAAVRAILDRCQSRAARMPSHIVLLHRSRQCNCPELLRKLFSTDARIAPRLTLAEQNLRTDWLRRADVKPAAQEQLALPWTS